MNIPLAEQAETSADPRAVALSRIYDLLRLVTAAAAILLAIWLISDVLMVVFAATLLAVILHGCAGLVHRFTKLPYWAALLVVIVVIVALLAGLGLVAGPGLSEQATKLRQSLGQQVHGLHDRLSHYNWGRAILDQVPSSLGGDKQGSAPGVPSGVAGSVAGALGSAIGLFGTVVVVVISGLYLASAPSVYVNGAIRLVPEVHRAKAKELFQTAGNALWMWSAGQALDMLVVGILSGVGLWIIGVPLALVLGVVAGLFNFVPYFGAITGAIPAILIAFSVGATTGVETVILYCVIQAFEGYVMSPLIQKQAVDMPPGLTILSQTAFGTILGIPGVIFATPLTAALQSVMGKATKPLAKQDEL